MAPLTIGGNVILTYIFEWGKNKKKIYIDH